MQADLLKKANLECEYTPAQIQELHKCMKDPVYFIRTYIKVQHPKLGSIFFDLYDYQEEMIESFQKNKFCINKLSRQAGKCVSPETKIQIIRKPKNYQETVLLVLYNKFGVFESLLEKALDYQEVHIAGLHEYCKPESCEIYDNQKLKFIEYSDNVEYLVKSDNRYIPIKRTYKTVPYKIHSIELDNGLTLSGADKHIVICNGYQRYLKDLKLDDVVNTVYGLKEVIDINISDISENMYDLELEGIHVYYTNGILSHNTTVIAAYLLWYCCFNFDKTVLVASNKNSNAMEIMQRIIYAYEELPIWLKPGTKYATKHSLEFDNGSRIFSQATTESTGRGLSCSLILLDELAFVPKRIQEEMWISLLPTLSTGGSCIISSTPNGDSDLFANLWRGSVLGTNDFASIEVKWDRVPDRDENFKNQMIGKIGELKWRQEYETEFLSSDPLLISSVILQKMKALKPLYKFKDITFYKEIDPDSIYFVGIDIGTGVGNDFSTMEILEFPSMEQVGEFRSNKLSIPKFYNKCKTCIKFILNGGNNESKKIPEVYWSYENNGVGAAFTTLFENDETFPDASLLSNKNRYGLATTGKNKILSCIELKNLIEKTRNNLVIYSPYLIEELKSYINAGKSYAAKNGATDDLISAMLIIIQMLKIVAEFEEDVFNEMYNYDDEYADDIDDEFGDDPIPMVF